MGKDQTQLINDLRQFKKTNKIEKMYLFGSQVTGKTNKWSDVDLIVVSKRFRGKGNLQRAPELYMKWTLACPVDFLCYTPEEFNKLKKQISIVSEALKEGMEI